MNLRPRLLYALQHNLLGAGVVAHPQARPGKQRQKAHHAQLLAGEAVFLGESSLEERRFAQPYSPNCMIASRKSSAIPLWPYFSAWRMPVS